MVVHPARCGAPGGKLGRPISALLHLAHLAESLSPTPQGSGTPSQACAAGLDPGGPCRHDVTAHVCWLLEAPAPINREGSCGHWPQLGCRWPAGGGGFRAPSPRLCSLGYSRGPQPSRPSLQAWSPLPLLLSLSFLLCKMGVTGIPISQAAASQVLGVRSLDKSLVRAVHALCGRGSLTLPRGPSVKWGSNPLSSHPIPRCVWRSQQGQVLQGQL